MTSLQDSTLTSNAAATDRSQLSKLKPLSAKDNYGWSEKATEICNQEIWGTLIGREVGREAFLDGQIRERQLRQQSDEIVDRLERCGIQGRSSRGGVSIVGLVSGQAQKATDYRNCNLIPIQQSKNVHDMLTHVKYMMSTAPKKNQFRMLVISGGWCPFDKYRKYHKAHTRRMSKFAAHKKLKKLGIKVQFYNVENTIHRADGVAMLNLHSHALYRSTRHLGKVKWNEFLEFTRNFFPKGYSHDSRIKKAQEVVKYAFKPSEFSLMSDGEFAEFSHQVIGGRSKVDPDTGEILTRLNDAGDTVEVKEGPLKFFHPLGLLREQRSEFRIHRQKLMMVPTSDGRWAWRKTEKKKPTPAPDDEGAGGFRENLVLAITRPMPKFNQRMEPCVVVQDYTGNFDQMVLENSLARSVSEAKSIFADRIRADEKSLSESRDACQGETPSMKHTTTTTVPTVSSIEASRHPPSALDPPISILPGCIH